MTYFRFFAPLAVCLMLALAPGCNPLDPAAIELDDPATSNNNNTTTNGGGDNTNGGGGGEQGGCGAVSDIGCCVGDQVRYCDGGALQSIDCPPGTCGYSVDGGYYDCNTDGGADPSGAAPKACP